MSDLLQTRSVPEDGNPPASPGVTHSDVVVHLFRELASRAGIPGTAAPTPALPAGSDLAGAGSDLPAIPLPFPVLPGAGGVPTSPPQIQSGIDPESAETTGAGSSQIPVSFEPFGSEVLKSLHEFGFGASGFDAPALPVPHEVPAAPSYYFLAPHA
jgi:hypothetical protein